MPVVTASRQPSAMEVIAVRWYQRTRRKPGGRRYFREGNADRDRGMGTPPRFPSRAARPACPCGSMGVGNTARTASARWRVVEGFGPESGWEKAEKDVTGG